MLSLLSFSLFDFDFKKETKTSTRVLNEKQVSHACTDDWCIIFPMKKKNTIEKRIQVGSRLVAHTVRVVHPLVLLA